MHTHVCNPYRYHIYLNILWQSCTHMKPCLHHFYNTKDIVPPHIPAVKKGVIVSMQLCHLYGFGGMFHMVNVFVLPFMKAVYLHKSLQFRWRQASLRKMWYGCQRTSSTLELKEWKEDLFTLCTTSFMASFIQMKAWQTYSSLFL